MNNKKLIEKIEKALEIYTDKNCFTNKEIAQHLAKEITKGEPKRKFQSDHVKYDIDNRLSIQLPSQISIDHNSFSDPKILFNKNKIIIETEYKKDKENIFHSKK